MKSIYTSKSFKVMLLVALFMAPIAFNVLFAQPGPPPPPPVPPSGVPIDGGLGMLLAGLAAYGAKKIWNK